MAKMVIGLKDFVYATLTSDDDTGAVYSTPVSIPGLTEATISPNVNSVTHYSDDKASYTDSKLSNIEFEMGIDDIPTEDQATLLGNSVDANGILIKSSDDKSPYVAIGFRSPLSDGGERLTWLYKGKFSETSDARTTQGDSIEVQTKSISATFIPLDYNNQWKAEVNTTDDGVSTAAVAGFFTSVYEASDTVTV